MGSAGGYDTQPQQARSPMQEDNHITTFQSKARAYRVQINRDRREYEEGGFCTFPTTIEQIDRWHAAVDYAAAAILRAYYGCQYDVKNSLLYCYYLHYYDLMDTDDIYESTQNTHARIMELLGP